MPICRNHLKKLVWKMWPLVSLWNPILSLLKLTSCFLISYFTTKTFNPHYGCLCTVIDRSLKVSCRVFFWGHFSSINRFCYFRRVSESCSSRYWQFYQWVDCKHSLSSFRCRWRWPFECRWIHFSHSSLRCSWNTWSGMFILPTMIDRLVRCWWPLLPLRQFVFWTNGA